MIVFRARGADTDIQAIMTVLYTGRIHVDTN